MVCSLQDKHVDAFTDKVGGHVNSVIGLLLRHNKAEIRILGARLLAQFQKVQVSLSCPWHFCRTSAFIHHVCMTLVPRTLNSTSHQSSCNAAVMLLSAVHKGRGTHNLGEHLQISFEEKNSALN